MNILSKLWPYLKPHKVAVAIILITGAIAGIALSQVIAMTKPLIDQGFAGSSVVELRKVIATAIGLYALTSLSKFVHLFTLKFTGERITVQIQKDLQSRYMDLSLSYHGENDSGAHISRIINDVTVIQWGLSIFADLFREPFTIIGLMVFVIHENWRMAAILFVGAPLIFLILRQLGRSVRKYSHYQQESLEKFTSTLKETLDGLRVIQSFRLEGEMKARLARVLESYLSARRKIIRRQEGAGPLTDTVSVTAFACILYYLGVQVITGHTQTGSVMAFIFALGSLQAPARKIQEGWARLEQTAVSVQRIFSILENKRVVPEVAQPSPFPSEWQSILFSHVNFQYQDKPVLKDINLEVRRGEIVALVGESGSGKSTLVNLLERFFDPTSGQVCIGGVPITQLKLAELRSHISLVTQDVFLFNDTIRQNIRAGSLDKEALSVETAAQLANAEIFIKDKPLGYETVVGERGSQLSGGEKQRVSIARAIYKNAPILILDEATSALDSASEIEVQKGLDKLMEGRTAFVIAHRLSTVMRADRIIVLEKGRIVEVGRHQELIERRGAYHRFHILQSSHASS